MSGKTKVLTSKVAYLIINHHVSPENIIVTTFTKKAANEMKERLASMLKHSGVSLNRLLIGTFHSICVKILKRHGSKIGLGNFSIGSDRDIIDLLKPILGKRKSQTNYHGIYKEGENPKEYSDPKNVKKVRNQISTLKSKGLSSLDYKNDENHDPDLCDIYQELEASMKELNILDFDDLLVHTTQLLSNYKVLKNIRYVLIDEFQDTNTIQLQLMREFGRQNTQFPDRITVVGDPDQSIYAFRDAVSQNFSLMRNFYSTTKTIILKENYRSVQDILNFGEEFMKKEKGRLTKTLNSQYAATFKPVYHKALDFVSESQYIVDEINTLKRLPNLFKYSDFSILVRASFLTRELEKALVSSKIPYTILKGRAFWERKEVTLILDFLRVIVNKNDRTAILRTFDSISKGVGSSTLEKINTLMKQQFRINRYDAFNVLNKVADSRLKIDRATGAFFLSLKEYLSVILHLEQMYLQDTRSNNNLVKIFDMLMELEVFKKLVEDSNEKKENLEEVKSQLSKFVPQEEDLSLDDGSLFISDQDPTILQNFLTSVDLYLTDSSDNNDAGDGKVVISTIHSAKGLEWPVVFVPAVRDGIIPMRQALNEENGEDEERRVFYVASTRSKLLLYILHSPSHDSGESAFMKGLQALGRTVKSQEAFQNVSRLTNLFKMQITEPPNINLLTNLIGYFKELEKKRIVDGKKSDELKLYTNLKSRAISNDLLAIPTVENRTRFAPKQYNVTSSSIMEASSAVHPNPSKRPTLRKPIANILSKKIDSKIRLPQDPVKITVDAATSKKNSVPQMVKRRKVLGMTRRRPT
ncbi:hypothetical protein WICMUC_004354 [Wickerhamomyces mucosus]|uniref:DNA 3'-5' helicase n=1 Tax=Wickerhamomyces mucosus TaxID=1378264 RepID=A0A9P8TB37_9ASCO|nr:hypothetical protein WICMUC_004354 [Wickerhamomyces mucosus]